MLFRSHGAGLVPVGDTGQRVVPGGSGGSLRSVARSRRHLDPDHLDRVQAQVAALGRGDCSDRCRFPLEAVVDDDGTRPQAQSGGDERRRRRERQGVRPPAARDQHQLFGPVASRACVLGPCAPGQRPDDAP